MSEGQSDRDILVELRADMRHVRQSMDQFRQSEAKQWDKLDDHGAKLEGQERDIRFLTKGFWVAVTSIFGGVIGVIVWLVNHRGG